MEFNFDRNKVTIKEIYDKFTDGTLIVDQSYQRRKVWMPQDKVRLIETILMGLIIPEVFFWPAQIDPDSGEMITHIVDGQQRITAIIEYITGEFELSNKCLLNDEIKAKYGNKKFNELPDEGKTQIWTYRMSVVDIDRNCDKSDITQMFYRLNLTNYSLNSQERRNSIESRFGDKAEGLSKLDFWKDCKVFSSADARRMKDIEYCCSIYILAQEGIVDQTNDQKINAYYDDYKVEFDEKDILRDKIIKAMEMITDLVDKKTLQFVSKKAQMYTLFCVMFEMQDKRIEMDNELFEKFKLFVNAYDLFKNGYDLNISDELERNVYEGIKKYKLASSEGINKVGNRAIRFEIMKKFLLDSEGKIKESFRNISKKLVDVSANSDIEFEKFEADDLVDIETQE